MPADTIAERVIAIVADSKKVPAGSVTAATSFAELGIDSLDALNLAFALEEAFQISIPDNQLRALKTVGEAIEGVRRLVEASSGAATA